MACFFSLSQFNPIKFSLGSLKFLFVNVFNICINICLLMFLIYIY